MSGLTTNLSCKSTSSAHTTESPRLCQGKPAEEGRDHSSQTSSLSTLIRTDLDRAPYHLMVRKFTATYMQKCRWSYIIFSTGRRCHPESLVLARQRVFFAIYSLPSITHSGYQRGTG